MLLILREGYFCGFFKICGERMNHFFCTDCLQTDCIFKRTVKKKGQLTLGTNLFCIIVYRFFSTEKFVLSLRRSHQENVSILLKFLDSEKAFTLTLVNTWLRAYCW